MAQRRHQAERAFEKLLRTQRIPYVAVNEARKSLLPFDPRGRADDTQPALKNFDFIVSGASTNLLVEVKGRSIPATRTRTAAHAPRPPAPPDPPASNPGSPSTTSSPWPAGSPSSAPATRPPSSSSTPAPPTPRPPTASSPRSSNSTTPGTPCAPSPWTTTAAA